MERHAYSDNIEEYVGWHVRRKEQGPLKNESNCLGQGWLCTSITYDLEYGQDTVEMHSDGIRSGERVLLVDDILATGGTMAACIQLVESLGGTVVGCQFIMELKFLGGRSRLEKYPLKVLIEE